MLLLLFVFVLFCFVLFCFVFVLFCFFVLRFCLFVCLFVFFLFFSSSFFCKSSVDIPNRSSHLKFSNSSQHQKLISSPHVPCIRTWKSYDGQYFTRYIAYTEIKTHTCDILLGRSQLLWLCNTQINNDFVEILVGRHNFKSGYPDNQLLQCTCILLYTFYPVSSQSRSLSDLKHWFTDKLSYRHEILKYSKKKKKKKKKT